MNLSSALYGAMAGVSAASAQISIVSRNIANQSNPNASRKIANVVTVNGLPSVASISQASNAALLTSLLSANSNQSQQSAISNAMTPAAKHAGHIREHSTSPTALIGQLIGRAADLCGFPAKLSERPSRRTWRPATWPTGSTAPAPRFKT